jgi:hypothetical protein
MKPHVVRRRIDQVDITRPHEVRDISPLHDEARGIRVRRLWF